MIELGYYCVGILSVSTLSSYVHKKLGIVVGIILTLLSFFMTFLGMHVTDDWEMFAITLVLFPAVTWFGFWLGRLFAKQQTS
jgi:hypothetical protein